MKKRWLLLSLIPLAFTLSGCSHISKVKVDKNSTATVTVTGKSHKDKVFYSYDNKKTQSVNVVENEFEINLPRKLTNKSVKVSGNKNLASAKIVSVPKSFLHLENGVHSTNINGYKVTFWLNNGKLMATRVTGYYPIKKFSKVVSYVASGLDTNFDQAEDKANHLKVSDGPIKSVKGKIQEEPDVYGPHYSGYNVYGKLTFDFYK
ncbi:hypothetical protein [Limosilactobacillus reuteri]|uniref:hypothetical protein n=1 Tax=Limosilactobacillus reuteri TaxID=1598 RepID=UPI001E540FB6|nr:hypothetical protein [Limosilactobacillus reuteri]MCC4466487.1 hypothetical protein [Limosilactobacillus reuteri]MCC4472163.1 hypothetical protein [Limosilactobacillus reuteri]